MQTNKRTTTRTTKIRKREKRKKRKRGEGEGCQKGKSPNKSCSTPKGYLKAY
jgi:hypothetical protein